MGNGTFMYRDFGFSFSFSFLSTFGKDASTKQGFQLSSLTRNLFFQFLFLFLFFFFLNESGLLSRAGQLGDLTIYVNELDSEFILHGTPPSLRFVVRHVQVSMACFSFPF